MPLQGVRLHLADPRVQVDHHHERGKSVREGAQHRVYLQPGGGAGDGAQAGAGDGGDCPPCSDQDGGSQPKCSDQGQMRGSRGRQVKDVSRPEGAEGDPGSRCHNIKPTGGGARKGHITPGN